MTCLITSCAHHLVGQKMNPGYCNSISEKEKTHNLKFQNSSIIFKHSIDDENALITVDGKLIFYQNKVGGGSNVLQAQIEFIFCDENYVAIASEQVYLRNKKKAEPMPFIKSFKYDKRYKYISIGWHATLD